MAFRTLAYAIMAAYVVAVVAIDIWMIIATFNVMGEADGWAREFLICVATDVIFTIVVFAFLLCFLPCYYFSKFPASNPDKKDGNNACLGGLFKMAIFIWAIIVAIHSDGDHVAIAEIYAIVTGVQTLVMYALFGIVSCLWAERTAASVVAPTAPVAELV